MNGWRTRFQVVSRDGWPDPQGPYQVVEENSGHIVTTVQCACEHCGDRFQTKKIADLLAAAPELLIALHDMVSALERVDLSPIPGLYDAIPWEAAESAIAKAGGPP